MHFPYFVITQPALVDVERAADLYAEGWTLRQIGAELGVSQTAVSDQLRQAGVTVQRLIMETSNEKIGDDRGKIGKLGAGPRREFRPRAVFKLHDWVAVPYEDGVQKLLAERYGPGPIEDIIDDITFERLYTALAAEKIARLVALEGSATRATKATGSTAGSPSTHRAACDPRS